MVLGSSGVSGVLTDTLRALPAGAPTMPLAQCQVSSAQPRCQRLAAAGRCKQTN